MPRHSAQTSPTRTADLPPARQAPAPARKPVPVRPLGGRSPAALRRTCRIKDALDRALALLLLIASAPVMLAAVLLVKLSSRGPGVYSQKRVGQFGHVFTIYKVRTMFNDCESKSGPRWSTPGDPRVTKVGRVLRALHIDELPQLWNVLRGEMSLIGPRPERPEIAAKLTAAVDDYNERVAVKPGISGHAQVNLPPDTNLASVRRKLVLDRFYIRNLSVGFDLKIMLFTALKLFGMRPQVKHAPAKAEG